MTIQTYTTDDGAVVIADAGGWCSGTYVDEPTARRAHRIGAAGMDEMWAAHHARHGTPPPPMTMAEVKAWKP